MIIIGTGAVAAEITMFFPDVTGYLEYSGNIDKYYNRYHLKAPILGDIDNYQPKKHDFFIVAAADILFREKVINIMREKGASFPNFIHDSAIICPEIAMGLGNVVYPQCIISTGVVMYSFNLLTCQSILSHDCNLGSNNVLATTLLCGHVTVGCNNSFGIRSTVIPHILIGDSNVIQAGMIVDKNITDNETVFYRYKEKLIIRS
jgi:acetyltransferase-like isoleucine patch superfamily enzyme